MAESKVITERRKLLQEKVDYLISKGWEGCCFQITEFDVTLIQPYCNSLGLEAWVGNCGGKHKNPLNDHSEERLVLSIKLKPKVKEKPVEEEDWAKDLEGPKKHWFIVWINKLLYRINR